MKRIRNLCCFFAVLLTFPLPAQQFNLIQRVEVPDAQHMTADPFGQIYLQTRKGQLIAYSPDGKLLHTSEGTAQAATSIDAGPSLRLFAFYQSRQTIRYFDRQLRAASILSLPAGDNQYYSLGTPSADNSLWLWEAGRQRLIRYKPALQTMIADIPAAYFLEEDADVNQITEYQNRVYVNDRRNQVLIFDGLGNYIQKLPVVGIEQMGFYGDELYWWDQHTISFYHLYEMQQRKVKLPEGVNPRQVLLSEDRLLLLQQEELLIYRWLSP